MKCLLISTRKGLITYTQKSGHWTQSALSFRGIPVCLTRYDPATSILWAFLDHGHWGVKIQKSIDFGATWREMPAMTYPEGSEVSDGVAASLKYIWSAEIDAHGRLWIGTVPGGLFMSEDGGETFQINQTLWNVPERKKQWFGGGMDYAGIHSIVFDPNDDNHFFIGISVAGVYETSDGGTTWTGRNKGLRADFLPDPHSEFGHDPHLRMACKSAPDNLWQQNHCGIFRSTDGAATWQDVSEKSGPANFGFAIAVDDDDPNSAWVVPGVGDEMRVAVDQALCVCRTVDGGKTWDALRKGLPQENCFDIVYRHALAKQGDELFFGTTTGNFFRSGDGGDSWETMSNFLPLINAVTFAET